MVVMGKQQLEEDLEEDLEELEAEAFPSTAGRDPVQLTEPRPIIMPPARRLTCPLIGLGTLSHTLAYFQ